VTFLKKNLVLTGMMSVGKSTVGKKLAKKLGFKLYDIDKIIERNEKNTIREIFTDKGENYFRKVEKKITLDALKKNNLVIALGGGAFINTSIRREVKNTSISYWLDLNLKSLLLRLKNIKKRPLLNENNLEESINKIYSERKEIYNESNFKINCNSLNVDQIVKKIIKLYESSGNKV
jgi:shikimate kinase